MYDTFTEAQGRHDAILERAHAWQHAYEHDRLADSTDRLPREHAVPCRVVGCPAVTFDWQALCGRHLESDEPTAPRRLQPVDPPHPPGDVDDQAPAGERPPAGRGQPLTA